MTDAVMLETAKVKLQYISDDLSPFTAFDPDFDARWVQDWQDAITLAETNLKDEVILGEQAQQTEAVLAALDRCVAKVREVRFFVKKAFPGNQPVYREFGHRMATAKKGIKGKLRIGDDCEGEGIRRRRLAGPGQAGRPAQQQKKSTYRPQLPWLFICCHMTPRTWPPESFLL